MLYNFATNYWKLSGSLFCSNELINRLINTAIRCWHVANICNVGCNCLVCSNNKMTILPVLPNNCTLPWSAHLLHGLRKHFVVLHSLWCFQHCYIVLKEMLIGGDLTSRANYLQDLPLRAASKFQITAMRVYG